jgi:hypothetical protein
MTFAEWRDSPLRSTSKAETNKCCPKYGPNMMSPTSDTSPMKRQSTHFLYFGFSRHNCELWFWFSGLYSSITRSWTHATTSDQYILGLVSKFLINIKLAFKGYGVWLLLMFVQALLRAFTIIIQHGIKHESIMPLALATFCWLDIEYIPCLSEIHAQVLELYIIYTPTNYCSLLLFLLQPMIASFRDHSAADSTSRSRCRWSFFLLCARILIDEIECLPPSTVLELASTPVHFDFNSHLLAQLQQSPEWSDWHGIIQYQTNPPDMINRTFNQWYVGIFVGIEFGLPDWVAASPICLCACTRTARTNIYTFFLFVMGDQSWQLHVGLSHWYRRKKYSPGMPCLSNLSVWSSVDGELHGNKSSTTLSQFNDHMWGFQTRMLRRWYRKGFGQAISVFLSSYNEP